MTIVNAVWTAELPIRCGERLPLAALARRLTNIEYAPQRFNAIVARMRRPRATLLLFPTGRMVATGCVRQADARRAVRRLARRLRCTARVSRVCIANVVVAGSVAGPLNLELLAHFWGGAYTPELFPAAQFRISTFAVTAFANGKWFATGIRSTELAENAEQRIRQSLAVFATVTR